MCVLDLLFVAALLGLQLDGEAGERHAFGFSQDDIQQIARGLGPGESAGIVLIEHVWSRDLRKVFRGAGGRMIGEGFLTPETIRAVEPQLAAISDAIASAERGGTPP